MQPSKVARLADLISLRSGKVSTITCQIAPCPSFVPVPTSGVSLLGGPVALIADLPMVHGFAWSVRNRTPAVSIVGLGHSLRSNL